MSDAAAPGPSSEGPDDEGAPGAGRPEVPTGEPDETLVEEAAAGAGADQDRPGGPGDEAGPDEPSTGLPDDTAATDAATGTGDTDAGGGGPGADDDLAAAATETAGGARGAGGRSGAELMTIVAGVEEARAEIAEVRAGVESMLPDLAATAREETMIAGLAAAAREETVAAGNARIQNSLDEMVRLTRRADDHVAELHAENQRLRAGELASATLPMIRDLVRLHDEVAQLASASHPEALSDLQLVRSRLLDTLARWGLAPFSPAVGDPLDANRHQGVGRAASPDGEPGTIATVRRPGFAHEDGRIFRPADVEVFQAPDPGDVRAPGPDDADPADTGTPDPDDTVVADPPAPPPASPPPDPPAAGQTEE